MPTRKNILIKGFTRGVTYCKQTQRVASNLGVNGWVRNLSNGDVEACLEGEEDAVDTLLAWCAFGPKYGQVDEVVISKRRYSGRYDGFSIREDRKVA